jgi:hypothetical protein
MYDLLELGDLPGALGSHRRLDELAHEIGQPLFRHSALVWKRVTELAAGRFDRAAQLAHEALNLARAAHGEGAQAHFIAQQLAVVPYQGGAARLTSAVRTRASDGDPMWSAAMCMLNGEIGERSTLDDRGHALGLEQLADLPRTVYWLTSLAWLADVSSQQHDHERAALLYELLAPYADRFVQLTFCGSFGCLHRHLGRLAALLGASRRAAEHFEEAVQRHVMISAPALEARARGDYAEALIEGRAVGSRRDATAMAERATALAEACGASRLAARLRRLPTAAVLQPQ